MKEKAKKKSKPKQQFSYTCPQCHKQFQDSSALYSHVKLHSTELPYQCELCDYKCKIKKYLTRHVKKTHTAPTGNQCAVCGKCFHFECKLRVHMRVHTGEKPYKCSECDKAFSSSYSLSGHKLIHTGEKPYQCQFCDYACRDTSTIRKHMERHMGVSKTYPCNICNKNYKNKRTLQIHVDEVHFELNTRKFPCGHCDKVFKTKGTLRIHWNTVHLKINRTKCEICGADVSKNNINSHMRRHIDVKPFKCSFKPCGKRFKDKSDLKRHCLIHYPDRQYACALCHRRFARKTRLNKHVSRHLNGYDVQCDYCGDMFATKLRLSTHITRSHGPNSKIYICDTCDMVFHSRRSITSHLMYGHGAEHDRVCQICKEDLNNYQTLKEHYLKHHNVKYNVLGEKKEDEDEVLIKEEPIDMEEFLEETPEFLYDVDIRKQDMDEEPQQPHQPQPPHSPTPDTSEQESDSLTYSKKVLSEDISRSIIERDADTHDVFDDFFIDHVLKKPEEGVRMPKHIVDEKKKECVEKRLEKLLHRVRLRKQCRVLEKLRIQYNRRIGMATSNGDKKEPKSIRYFKNTQKSKETENQKDINNDKDITKEKHSEPIDQSKDDSNIQKIRTRGDEKIKDRSDDDDDKDINYRESDSESDEEIQNKKLKFNTHQCYICFKLFKTKTELKRHCRHHFDICNEKMLKKCPFCGYVTNKQISRHIRLVHKLDLDIPYARIKERDTQTGSKYVFEIDKDCDLEIIPSISNLNKIASMKIDEKNRADKNVFLGTTKLVKKGGDWMVEKEKVNVSNEYLLPEFSKEDYLALKSVGNNYLERIRSLSIVAKKRGLKILYPCEGCEKICLTMSALKLHNRKHEINPKRFKPKVWKNKIVNGKPGKNKNSNNKRKKQYSNNNENTSIKSVTINKAPKNNKKGKLEKIDSNLESKVANRFADPNPVKNKHKCDKKLIEFYKNNIKGGDIEFWQFLKIFNRMGRENVNDFEDLENRFDFGMHNIKSNIDTTENAEKLPVVNNEVPNKIVSKKKAFTRAIMISKKEYLKRLEIKNQMRQRLGLLKT
ncbi:uncharacterized protein LOC124644508 [Helicoverpa zea]|uniref:uncharacterized protein LOC124644508 n=1 Tax=Helicoverpa zea TaxID=7113 RepID=UPI001F5A2CF6|nr:uncharacterized protein LOC124644508 [Helicoverpa zea]